MKFYTLILSAACLWACQMSTNVDHDIIVANGKHTMKNAPGTIPMDAGIQDIMLDENSTYRSYDEYYNTLDDRFKGESFLENLKWMTIEHMVLFSDFELADESIKRFYIDEIFSRSFINNPAVLLKIFKEAKTLTEKEKAYYAFRLITINKEHLAGNPDYKASHEALNKDSYSQLHQLAYSRWGEPRHELLN